MIRAFLRRIALLPAALIGATLGLIYAFLIFLLVLLVMAYIFLRLVFEAPVAIWNAAAGKGRQ
jgi:hypothetical protein